VSRRAAGALAAAFTALVLLATLLPGTERPPDPGAAARLLPEDFLSDAVRNVLLFLPLGVLLRRAGRRPLGVAGVGAALSSFVEAMQFAVPSRHPSLLDLVCNTAGTAVGAWLAPRLAELLDPPPPGARRLAQGWAGAVALFLVAQGPLATPALPPLPWHAGVRPEFGHLPVYPGEVIGARIGDRRLHPGRVEGAGRLRELVARGAPVVLRARAGPAPPAGPAPLFTLHGARQTLALAVGVDGGDLLFEVRTRARALGLETAAHRAPGLLAGLAPGEPYRVRIEPGRDGACATAHLEAREPPEIRRRCGLGPRPGDGFGFFFYAELPPPAWRPAVGCLWLGLLALPLGFWPAGARLQGLLVAIVGALVAGVPAVSPLAPARPAEILAPAAGAAVGRLLRRLYGRGPKPSRTGDPRPEDRSSSRARPRARPGQPRGAAAEIREPPQPSGRVW